MAVDQEEIFLKTCETLDKNIISVRSDLNRAILFTCLPILGIAIAFFISINSGNSTNQVTHLETLHASAFCLIGAVFTVIISYWTDMIAYRTIKKGLEDFFFQEGREPKSVFSIITTCLIFASTVLYILGIALASKFFYQNLTG